VNWDYQGAHLALVAGSEPGSESEARMKAFLKAFGLLVVLTAAFVFVAFVWIGSRGVSAKAEPGRVETTLARTMRDLAIPKAAREAENPISSSPTVIAEGLTHFADHCAVCHANNGSGETELGRRLYPRPPDMRLAATQSLTDGELFYVIENGVRLTGMPAWSTGTEEGRASSWRLVHFIRELPRLTPSQLKEMEQLNPKPPQRLPNGAEHPHKN
jgi:mono/diheme cytochrome c family protein